MPSRTFLYGITGRPIVLFDFSGGSTSLISFHSLSGIFSYCWKIFDSSISHIFRKNFSSYMFICHFWDRFLRVNSNLTSRLLVNGGIFDGISTAVNPFSEK